MSSRRRLQWAFRRSAVTVVARRVGPRGARARKRVPGDRESDDTVVIVVEGDDPVVVVVEGGDPKSPRREDGATEDAGDGEGRSLVRPPDRGVVGLASRRAPLDPDLTLRRV